MTALEQACITAGPLLLCFRRAWCILLILRLDLIILGIDLF